jgi:ATP adenylyltransferase
MTDTPSDANQNCNIWAPWRMEYIESLAADDDGCFLCRAHQEDQDASNLVLWRGPRTITVLNRFPYTGGHCLIAPAEHVANLSELDDATMLEIMRVARDTQAVLTEAIKAQGFNTGFNLGRCAGAGLPGHIHMHVVPRWPGDVNLMAVLGQVRVVPVSLAELYESITAAAERLGLPDFEGKG